MRFCIVYDHQKVLESEFANAIVGMLRKDHFHAEDYQVNQVIPFNSFDHIIIGTSVSAKSIDSGLMRFLIIHENELKKKRVSLFLCDEDDDEPQQAFEQVFPSWLSRHSLANVVIATDHNNEVKLSNDRLLIGKRMVGKGPISKRPLLIEFYETMMT